MSSPPVPQVRQTPATPHTNTQKTRYRHYRHYGQVLLEVRREAWLLANPSRGREPTINRVHHRRRVLSSHGHLPRPPTTSTPRYGEADDLGTCYDDAHNLLLACREHNITLGKKKFTFVSAAVKFAGFIISDTGVKSDPAKIDAVTRFPKPTNITELRSFFG